MPVRVTSTCRPETKRRRKTNDACTHVVSWRHGHDGRLRGQDDVSQRPALVHNLLDHVTGGHLHWHRDGGRRIRRHHRHSHRPCKSKQPRHFGYSLVAHRLDAIRPTSSGSSGRRDWNIKKFSYACNRPWRPVGLWSVPFSHTVGS
jgi:hypothetical protein